MCDCTGAIGASGTGKGLFVFSRLGPLLDTRLVLVWSPLEATDRYGYRLRAPVVSSDVPRLVSLIKRGSRTLVFVPDLTGRVVKDASGKQRKLFDVQFEMFCRIVWNCPGCVAVVEELSRVTSPSYAPQLWQNLSTAGRHQGITLIATAQRPAQIDKDFLGNCTEIRAYRVNYDADARALASVMRAEPELFLELPDREFLHRWIRERRWERGTQPLPGAGAVVVHAAGEGAYAPVTAPVVVDRKKKLGQKLRKSR